MCIYHMCIYIIQLESTFNNCTIQFIYSYNIYKIYRRAKWGGGPAQADAGGHIVLNRSSDENECNPILGEEYIYNIL